VGRGGLPPRWDGGALRAPHAHHLGDYLIGDPVRFVRRRRRLAVWRLEDAAIDPSRPDDGSGIDRSRLYGEEEDTLSVLPALLHTLHTVKDVCIYV
jgi:hypothetical protein